MERYGRGPVTGNPRLKRGVNAWALALWVLGIALAVGSVYVAIRIYCWYGCVTPFDETWQRRIEAAAFAQEEAAGLGDGQRKHVTLPYEYSHLSETGETIVERVDNDLVVIFVQSDSAMVYAPAGIAEGGRFLDAYCIRTVRRQGSSWYHVLLNDYLPQLGPCR